MEKDLGTGLDLPPSLEIFHHLWAPILPHEIKRVLLEKNTGDGPNGISSKELRKITPEVLSWIFNLFILTESLPIDSVRLAQY